MDTIKLLNGYNAETECELPPIEKDGERYKLRVANSPEIRWCTRGELENAIRRSRNIYTGKRNTIWDAIEKGRQECLKYGDGHTDIYMCSEENVDKGWTRFKTSSAHIAGSVYRYVGYVERDGYYKVESHLTKG